MSEATKDIVIVGSGPAGLACAIEAQKANLSYTVLEKGSLTDSIRRFPTNMTFFSTPELLEIGEVPFITSAFRPTRIDVLRYYQRVAQRYKLHINFDSRVDGIQRNGDKFRVKTSNLTYECQFVVVATGYYDNPNPYGVPGVDLPKVFRYYMEPYPYVGREVAIIGGKNSAVDAALELFRSGANVTIVHRGLTLSEGVKYWLLPDVENRIKAGEIRAFFETTVEEIRDRSIFLKGKNNLVLANDYVFVMIGYRPDNRLLESVGVHIDPESLAPVHNPTTMETNADGLYVAGSIAAGRHNNKIFIENGRMHGKLIVDAIMKK